MAASVPPGGDILFLTAAGSCLAAAVLLALACGRGPRMPVFLALFWMLGIFCYCSAALTPPLRQGPWPPAERALSRLRMAIDAAGFPHASTTALLQALLTGRRDRLDAETVATFRAAGASHLLALSGLHLGMLYAILHLLLRWLGRSRPATLLRSFLQVGFAAGYVIMTGASPSLVRAFLFILLSELARLLPGRRRNPLNFYCTALTLQLAISPGVITSLGFQLSYLAMLGIVLLFPRLDAWYPRGPRLDPLCRIWSGVALTLSCQLFTAPLVWLRFRQFPKYFLLTNLGAMPLTEAFICCSLAVLAAGRHCPEGIKNLADTVGQILMFFLETVASIP